MIDYFENTSQYLIVLEHVDGTDLYEYIKRRDNKVPLERARSIIVKLAEALRYLHQLGIVHRDLKLENVMMAEHSDSPKLIDFGLARVLAPQEKCEEPFGTLGYVAPEVLRRQPYSFSCDVWSLGCIAHALVAGKLPFDPSHGTD